MMRGPNTPAPVGTSAHLGLSTGPATLSRFHRHCMSVPCAHMCTCLSHALHVHICMLSVSVSPFLALTQNSGWFSLLSTQFPGLMGLSQMPPCLGPRSLPLRRGLRAKPRMCSHNHCNHSATLGTMPLWEPPPPDLNCPPALPGEGEARMGAQRGRWLPTRLRGAAHTPPPSRG